MSLANEKLMSRLRKVLALKSSSSEGEAAAAAATLARLLEKHNLDIADLEARGQEKPGISEAEFDLGRSAWEWKTNLSAVLAEHYHCVAIVRHGHVGKQQHYKVTGVAFVGRPDNAKSLHMLYTWLVGQIQEFSREERRTHAATTGEHVDPLRWQLHFGIGAVERLGERLVERRQREAEQAGTALAIRLGGEVSDHLEEKYGYRADGGETKVEKARREAQEAASKLYDLERAEEEAKAAALKNAGDLEGYYALRPWERPEVPVEETGLQREKREAKEEREEARDRKRYAKERAKWRRQDEAREEREYAAERRRRNDPAHRRRLRQSQDANAAGNAAANRLQLEPFLETDAKPTKGEIA